MIIELWLMCFNISLAFTYLQREDLGMFALHIGLSIFCAIVAHLFYDDLKSKK